MGTVRAASLALMDGDIASIRSTSTAWRASATGKGQLHRLGRAEGRQVTFDGLQYIASYGDLIRALGPDRDAGAVHYITFGSAEHRAIDNFDAEQYLANYADLRAAFGDDTEAAALHFINYGFAEHRTDQPLTAWCGRLPPNPPRTAPSARRAWAGGTGDPLQTCPRSKPWRRLAVWKRWRSNAA
ncbi:MAG: hypothetical protein U1E52_00555 [Geminicoccaceae bacterium]